MEVNVDVDLEIRGILVGFTGVSFSLMSEAAVQFRQQCSRGSVRMARCGLVAECQEFGDDDCQSMILNNELVGYEGACKHELWGHAWRSRIQSPTSGVLGTSKTTLDWTRLSGACVPSKPLPLLATVLSWKHS